MSTSVSVQNGTSVICEHCIQMYINSIFFSLVFLTLRLILILTSVFERLSIISGLVTAIVRLILRPSYVQSVMMEGYFQMWCVSLIIEYKMD